MNISPEQLNEMFTRKVPDSKICLHELRIEPVGVEIDGDTEYGYVARLAGHDAEGKPLTIDFVTTEPILQEAMTRLVTAGMTAAFQRATQELTKTGDATALMGILLLSADEEGD